ncbi:MAG TPA: HAMP domain-containing sensor histidine kinase [Longimicrobium sp.]|nr:HAMP domain-containing sensor histidine kinase [Longimicrobium sp.]
MRAPVRPLPVAPRRDAATPARRRPAQLRVLPAADAVDAAQWMYPRPAAPAPAAPRWGDQAVAAVSHDLRNPLNAISLAAELLRRAWPNDPALLPERGLLDGILASTEQARRLVMDLLDQSLLDAGGIPVTPEAVELGPVLRAAAEAHRLLAQQRGITLTVIDATPAPVRADAARVDQVLGNLIGNALSHTPHGGRITIATERAGGEVRVSVSDNGRGIQPEDLPRIFEQNWRGAGGNVHGAGLGLSIARAIVEAHGGRITAQGAPGQGATFTFTLPLA